MNAFFSFMRHACRQRQNSSIFSLSLTFRQQQPRTNVLPFSSCRRMAPLSCRAYLTGRLWNREWRVVLAAKCDRQCPFSCMGKGIAAVAAANPELAGDSVTDDEVDQLRPPEHPGDDPNLIARLIEEDDHNIKHSYIPAVALKIILQLRGAGHEVYIVGGAVRDLVLQIRPKDFDILTSANPLQVRRLLPGSMIIGRRHPIVKLTQQGSEIDISSFCTGETLALPEDIAAQLGGKDWAKDNKRKRKGSSGRNGREKSRKGGDSHRNRGRSLSDSEIDVGSNRIGKIASWCIARRRNALDRDFTINSMMYDPFSRIVFDYTSGFKHCRERLLKFIVDARASISKDPARVLRAVRLAARIGLEIDQEAVDAMQEFKPQIKGLNKSRVQMEIDTIMSCGASAKSVHLLWHLKLLDLIFPPVAVILGKLESPRTQKCDYKQDSLFRILRRMDSHASAQRHLPEHVWQAVMVGFVAHNLKDVEDTPREDTSFKAEHDAEGDTLDEDEENEDGAEEDFMEDDVYDEIDDDEDEDDDDNDDDKDESTTQSDESEAALEGKDISEDEHMVDLLDSKEYSSQADDAFQFHNLSDSEEEEMTLLDFGGDTTQAVARPKSAQAKFSIFEKPSQLHWKDALQGFTSGMGTIPKGKARFVMKMLQSARHKKGREGVLCYKCRGCEKKTTLPVSTRPGACGECGRELPLKAWKDANMPGKEVVQVALQQWCS